MLLSVRDILWSNETMERRCPYVVVWRPGVPAQTTVGKGLYMKTRSVLIRFPGYPLALESLLPDRHLAVWAGCLLDLGHRTRIFDYGTLEMLDRQFPREGRDLLRQLCERFGTEGPMPPLGAMLGYWQLRQTDRAFRTRQEKVAREIARDLADRKGLDFVLFKLSAADDVAPAAAMAARLREWRPELRLFAAGPFADLFAEPLMERIPALDCICVGDIERSLVRLAENLRNPEIWEEIPNLVLRVAGRPWATPRRMESDLGVFPAPAYDPHVYPALGRPGKLMLFAVEDSRGRDLPAHAMPAWERELRLKDQFAVCNEVWRLNALYGAQAFHFTGAGSPAYHVQDVARALQLRGLRIVYSRSTRPDAVEPAGLPLLRASGCRALDFRIDSGSQRLLEDYYGHDFGISQVEQVMRNCGSFEMFTAARFVYPCPADDYHTEAETIRLVNRIRPDAVHVGLPEVFPGSNWYERCGRFGFSLNRRTYLDDILKCRTRFPLPPHRWPMAPYRMGRLSSGEVIRQQERLILALEDKTKVLYFSGELALWARLTGYSGREEDFQSLSRRLMATEGLAGIAALVDSFNERACAPTKAVGFRPLAPLRAAVGN